ncbi:hypothetical protein D3C85_1555590 [compost metagenome]
MALERFERAQWVFLFLAHNQLGAGVTVGFAEIQALFEFVSGGNMVKGNVIFAAFNTRQQVVASSDHELGTHIRFFRQFLAEFNFEAGQFAVILEVERRHIGLDGNA